MKKSLYYLILVELLIVLILTIAWEFSLEDFTFGFINVNHVPDDLTERLEYIITSSAFVCPALIVPLWIIIKDPGLRKPVHSFRRRWIILKLLEVCYPCVPTARIFVIRPSIFTIAVPVIPFKIHPLSAL